MTDSDSDERRLAIAAASGVGKSALLRYLQSDPRLSRWIVADVDSYRRSKPPELNSETPALRALLKQKVDVLFGVMIGEGLRALLEEKGWSLWVLSLPETEHRARLAQALGKVGCPALEVEEIIAVQRELESLGHPTIDAGRSIEAVAEDIMHTVQGGDRRQRFAFLGSWGVGKTALARYLRTGIRASRRWQSRLIVDSSWFMPGPGFGEGVDVPSPALRDAIEAWSRAERRAVRAAIRKKVDVVGATLSTRKRRALLEEEGFEFVVLSLAEPLHRARLARRHSETGRVVDVDSAIERQRKLESLGYDVIDAGRPLREVADDVVARVVGMSAELDALPRA